MSDFEFLFNNFFGSAMTTEDYKEKLDKYWSDGKIDDYYKIYFRATGSGLRVVRGSDGVHTVGSG